MADCSRPPHNQHRSLSKNLSGVFGFRSKGTYDDVFVTRPQMRAPAFTPGSKDYAEIFNCSSRPSSIPYLELDEFDKREEQVDYGNVFGGGLNEAQIGSSYEEVFRVGGDGVSRTYDSHSHARGPGQSTTVEESQKLPHESLHEKKNSISSYKITRGGKSNTEGKNSLAKISEVPVSTRSFDGTVPLKKASVSRSGETMNNFKQYSDEVSVGKHYRNVDSSGLPVHDAEGFIEIDMQCGNGYSSDKSVSSDTQMVKNIIRPIVQISEAATATDSSVHLGGSMATSNDLYRSNAGEESDGGFNSFSQEGAHVQTQSMHGPDKHDALRTKVILSSGLTHDHGGAFVTPEILTGNSGARNSNGSENAKSDSCSFSEQDVKFQTGNGLRKSSVNNFPVNASDVRPQESSKFTAATHSQHTFGKMNTACEGNVIPKITDSRSVDSESTVRDSNEYLADNVKSKNKVEHVGLDVKKASTSKSDVSKRSTYSSVKDNNSPCSSDDEIDKSSEASVSAAAAKKAIKEAQALINIAKESNGVKGFMSLAMARKSGQVKVAKEHNSNVKENPKFFELGQAEVKNKFNTSAVGKDYTAPWSNEACAPDDGPRSAMKMAPDDVVVEEVNLKGTEFSKLDKPGLMKAVEMLSSLKNKTPEPATTQHAQPSVNTFEEKLAVYSCIVDEKLVHRKEDATLHSIDADTGQVGLVLEAYCSIVPNVEKRETEVNSPGHEAFINSNNESNTAINITEAEKESQMTMNNNDQGFMMQSFYDDCVQIRAGCSADSFEVKEDATSITEHIRTNQHEAPKVENEGHVSSDLTSFEEETMKESELDPHDQLLDCEDTDSQDYASAEENWVSTDTDDETNDMDHKFSAQKNLDEIEEKENMVVPEVTVITEDVSAPSFNNLDEGQIVEVTDDVSLQSIVSNEAQDSYEWTTPVFHNSNENQVVEETARSEDMPLQNMVTPEAEVTSVTAPIYNHPNEDLIVEEADGSEKVTLHNMVMHEVNFTSVERTVPFFNYSDKDPIVEEADISEDAPILYIVTSTKRITSEDGALSCFNSADGDPRVETEGTEDMTQQNIVTPEAIKNDITPCFDNSNEDLVGGDNAGDITSNSRVSLPNNEHEKGTTGVAELHKQTALNIEELDCVARVETESASCANHEFSYSEGSEVVLISTDNLTEESGADAIEESRSTPWTFEPEIQEVEDTNFCNFNPTLQDIEALQNDAGIEADATEDGHETMNIKGFESDYVTVDTAGKEDVIETESTPLNSEHVNLEQESEVQYSEPLPHFSNHKEATEFEQLNENFIQPVERHERRKWEIPKETFELPELQIGASVIQDTMKRDSIEMERQMDKHERKKWEIPLENFELPVLGDEVVDENEENVHDTERATQSAEKPERKKWKIQKEVFEVPMLYAEAPQDTLEHEGFVIKTPAVEEMGTMDNLSNVFMIPEGMVQHDEVPIGFSGNEVVPDEGTSSKLCGENLEENIRKEWLPETKMVYDEEPCKQLGKTLNQQETNVGEGKAVRQEECTKGPEDINVKDEIKRTLGMLWKKIYNVKHDEDSESAVLVGMEKVTFKDKIEQGFEKDLNLKGPVELVESPRQQDDMEDLNFSGNRIGNEENREAASYSESFEVNGSTCTSNEFISMETSDTQRNSPLGFDSCKYQKDEKGSGAEENVESQTEEVLSSSGSEDWTETAQIHKACDLKKEGTLKCNNLPSNVNEYRQIDSETVSGFRPFLLDESLTKIAENTQKAKVSQQNELKIEQADTSDEDVSEVEVETHLVDDLSDKRCTNSEQQDTISNRQDIKSVSDSEVPDVTPSQGFEQKTDKNENCSDNIEQASSWKWIFGDELRDKSYEQDEAKAKTQETADEINASHITRKAKINGDKPTSMEDKVVISDQDVLKNLMRTKEIERIAVERAIREARERAFIEARERAAMERANAEARERAAKEKSNLESRERIALERANAEAGERAAMERANADAHQKVTSNFQERSQRTSSETKLASEKNSLEAKRKAELERAAVERATTEARQRALEKAMSRKEQATQTSSSRSTITSNDQSGSSSKDRLNDDKPSESALRFKARNERHQRIAERAAKALEEKNMRDLLVQREQAERNRLAEVLDADVKRWARGKTGNLRALLSTLQYILGPDSGWQPIHLTEIVTADAVKKAYRKATLFVHPDKLQQRGATIRQKYICEKVFDLLKEAWNKFDRDER